MKKVIVTGATGFIGGALTKKLLSMGVKVYGVDINAERLETMKQYGDFVPIVADFTKYANLSEIINESGFDVFFHFAWQGVFGDSFKDYRLQLNNAAYAADAIMAAKSLNCHKFVLAGTYNEYEIENFMRSDSFTPRYTCIYSTSKMAAELVCKTLAFQNGIEYSAGRICMAYGEGNRSKMLANIVINQLNNKKNPKLIEGNNYYDMIYNIYIKEMLLCARRRPIKQRIFILEERLTMNFPTATELQLHREIINFPFAMQERLKNIMQ